MNRNDVILEWERRGGRGSSQWEDPGRGGRESSQWEDLGRGGEVLGGGRVL